MATVVLCGELPANVFEPAPWQDIFTDIESLLSKCTKISEFPEGLIRNDSIIAYNPEKGIVYMFSTIEAENREHNFARIRRGMEHFERENFDLYLLKHNS